MESNHNMENNLRSIDGTSDRSYLTQSLENVPFFRARYSSKITDEQRMELILNELSLVGKEVENKKIETQCKANSYRILNMISSLIIILCSAVIVGIQAASDCINIPVIVLSSIIFATESTHKLFGWGPQGVLYKHGSIQLNRISRQVREYMYFFHRYSAEQLLALITMLRTQYDDVDVGLYKLSINGAARYNTGFDIEQPNTGNDGSGLLNPVRNTPLLPSATGMASFNHSTVSAPVLRNDSPHVHIHIGDTTPLPKGDNSTPVLTIPSTPPTDINTSGMVSPLNHPSVRNLSQTRQPSTPGTPRRTPMALSARWKTSSPDNKAPSKVMSGKVMSGKAVSRKEWDESPKVTSRKEWNESSSDVRVVIDIPTINVDSEGEPPIAINRSPQH